MLTFPNAKINLGLNIINKRPDGYHDLESCFYPIPWTDALEIIKSDTFSFTSSGLSIPGNQDTNLCIKAYQLLQEKYEIGPVKIHLHKVIPMGAGLGGGSADGAFTIKMLNDLFDLQLPDEEMENLAGQLGSDCPFFIQNKPVIATGTGTTFHPISLDLTDKFIALKHPNIHIGTKEAYANVTPKKPERPVSEIIGLDISEWKQWLVNDFEASVFPRHPEIETIKNDLYKSGAIYASMSGSGSAVYGLFENGPDLDGFEVFRLNHN